MWQNRSTCYDHILWSCCSAPQHVCSIQYRRLWTKLELLHWLEKRIWLPNGTSFSPIQCFRHCFQSLWLFQAGFRHIFSWIIFLQAWLYLSFQFYQQMAPTTKTFLHLTWCFLHSLPTHSSFSSVAIRNVIFCPWNCWRRWRMSLHACLTKFWACWIICVLC